MLIETLTLSLLGAADGASASYAAFGGATISTPGGALFDSQLVYSLTATRAAQNLAGTRRRQAPPFSCNELIWQCIYAPPVRSVPAAATTPGPRISNTGSCCTARPKGVIDLEAQCVQADDFGRIRPCVDAHEQAGAAGGSSTASRWTTNLLVAAIYHALQTAKRKWVGTMRSSVLNFTVQVTLACLAAQPVVHAQGRRGASGPPPTAEAAAPVDFTGYWESIVTDEDWVYRMVTPRPGDSAGVPLKPAGLQIMDAWDPAKDTAAGEQCKSYGAPAIMRVPGHLHVTWQDEQTLKIETDAGQQTRLLHFVKSDADQGQKTLQGYSVAEWELQRPAGGRAAAAARPVGGALRVTTTDLTAGYLRKNGIPYSESTQLLEYFDLVKDSPDDSGDSLMVLTTIVTDPVYLFQPFVTDENFLKMPSDAGWEPSACSAIW